MQHDQLRELAVVLTQLVRENATIDWTIKENVREKLKVIVKRTLRQYGYPPDMQLLVTETVLKHAEMIANELGNSLIMPPLEHLVLVCKISLRPDH
jgi:type I restriction enzyme, R subunit